MSEWTMNFESHIDERLSKNLMQPATDLNGTGAQWKLCLQSQIDILPDSFLKKYYGRVQCLLLVGSDGKKETDWTQEETICAWTIDYHEAVGSLRSAPKTNELLHTGFPICLAGAPRVRCTDLP
jgi:hypothetical protein